MKGNKIFKFITAIGRKAAVKAGGTAPGSPRFDGMIYLWSVSSRLVREIM